MASGTSLRPTATSSAAAAAATRPSTPLPLLLPLDVPVRHSADVWQDDLAALFAQAKVRFGDVSWQVGQAPDGHDNCDSSDDDDDDGHGLALGPRRATRPLGQRDGGSIKTIWGHKAIVYARAPPAFQARYFPPSQLRIPSPLGSVYSDRSSSTAHLAPPSLASASLRVPSRVSLTSTAGAQSTATLRPPFQIRVDATPQMFQAELEWLYTGQGMGEVIEWLEQSAGPRAVETSVADGGGGASSGLAGLGVGLEMPSSAVAEGRRTDPGHLKRERLRTDLVYMWRSKLFADVKLVLPIDPSGVAGPAGSSILGPDHSPNDQSLLEDTTSTTATFSAHKFILASRSPYFAQLLLNPGGFRSVDPTRSEIKLSSPPFTPASVHFCLGYMYAGTLAFSNRKHDLQTAFQIHRAASYLQMASLRSEIEARIVHEMCDSLVMDAAKPPAKLTSRRVPRVWRFAAAPDVGARELEQRCRDWVVNHWADCWGREVGSVGKRERDGLVKDTLAALRPDGVVAFYRGLIAIRSRTEVELRTVQPRGLKQSAWSENLLGMALEIEQRTRAVLVRHAEKVFASDAFAGLLEGRGFERELLEKIMSDLAAGLSGPDSCKAAGRVYQCLVASLLLKVESDSSEPVLPPGSANRTLIEETRLEILKHVRRRWMQIREAGGFQDLERWALKEIADEIDQPESELLAAPLVESKTPLRKPPVLSSSIRGTRLTESPSVRSIASSTSGRALSTSSARAPTVARATARPASSASAAAARPRPPAVVQVPSRATSTTNPSARSTATVLRKSTSTSSMPAVRPSPTQAGRAPTSAPSVAPMRRVAQTSSARDGGSSNPSPLRTLPTTSKLGPARTTVIRPTIVPRCVTAPCSSGSSPLPAMPPPRQQPEPQQTQCSSAEPTSGLHIARPPSAVLEAPSSPAGSTQSLSAARAASDASSQRSSLATFVMASGPTTTTRPGRYNPAAAFDPPRRMPLRPVQSQEAFVVRDVTTLEPAAAETGVSFSVGIPVLFHAMGRSKPSCFGRAFVRYIGRLKGEKGPWVGLEVVEAGLETIFPLHRDGTFRGVKYFELGEEDEHNWHSSRSHLEGERRRKSSGTSGATSAATSESSSSYQGPQRRLAPDQPQPTEGFLRPCIFVRPADVAWVNPN